MYHKYRLSGRRIIDNSTGLAIFTAAKRGGAYYHFKHNKLDQVYVESIPAIKTTRAVCR